MPDHILISELYGPVLQGEGALAGQLSHFLRTAGCEYRCTWCDSMHAVDPLRIKATAKRMTVDEILGAADKLPKVPWITLTGGDPVAWDLGRLCIELSLGLEYKIAVETQGALWADWLRTCTLITCSPKPPSSGMADRLNLKMLKKYKRALYEKLVFKVVAFDEADLDFAERLHNGFPSVPMYITSGTPMPSPGWKEGIPGMGDDEPIQSRVLHGFRTISEAVLRRPNLYDVTVGVQQHVLLWGRELGR